MNDADRVRSIERKAELLLLERLLEERTRRVPPPPGPDEAAVSLLRHQIREVMTLIAQALDEPVDNVVPIRLVPPGSRRPSTRSAQAIGGSL